MHLAPQARRARLKPSEEKLPTPLCVAGVGDGSQVANRGGHCPIATTSRDGVAIQRGVRALAVEGVDADLPAILGLHCSRTAGWR
eukprot:7214010-Pyramimonas_sp.AAC.1